MPALLLVDVEMPRMDGFDLTRNVRSDDKTRAIPVIMITSRSADKHRTHAFELGVNAYSASRSRRTNCCCRVGAPAGGAACGTTSPRAFTTA
jgi:chemosensory pili system protein ChpA (sensor histidine kinase/response regulator)